MFGLTGQVDPGVLERLYQQSSGPNGDVLARRRQSQAADQQEDARATLAGRIHAEDGHPPGVAVLLST